MKTLDRLIRYQKKKMDEQRLFVAQVTERVERLQAEIGQLDQNLKREGDLAMETIEGALTFPPYARGVSLRKKKVQRYLKEVQIQLEQEQKKLYVQFEELKRYEIIHEATIKAEQGSLEKKHQNTQDEINMSRYYERQNQKP